MKLNLHTQNLLVIFTFLGLLLDASGVFAQSKSRPDGIFDWNRKPPKNNELKSPSFIGGDPLPNGVNDKWLPREFTVSFTDTSIKNYRVERDYIGSRIKAERVFRTLGEEFLYETQEWQYWGDTALMLEVFPEEEAIPESFMTGNYKSIPFFKGVDFFNYTFRIEKGTPYTMERRRYRSWDSSSVKLDDGRFMGYTQFGDPYWDPNGLGEVFSHQIIPLYDSELEILNPDSALYHERFFNGETYDTLVDYVKLQDGIIHTVYEDIPFTERKYFEKVVFHSWHDPALFQAKEWSYYQTSDSGATWQPMEYRIFDGVDQEWTIDQYFEFENGDWKYVKNNQKYFNPHTGRRVFQTYNDSIWGDEYYGIAISEQDSNDRILTEVYISKNDTNHTLFYTDHIPASGVAESQKVPFLVYPNPCTETLYFSQTQGKAQLFNISGQWIQEVDLSWGSLDVRKLPVGLYRLVSDEHEWVAGFVKE